MWATITPINRLGIMFQFDTEIEFGQYRYTDTDTYLPIIFKPIPILGFPFYFLPIQIPVIWYEYLYHTDNDTDIDVFLKFIANINRY
jgi:hypothetical protein